MAQLEKQVQEHIMESEVELKLLNTKMATQKADPLSESELASTSKRYFNAVNAPSVYADSGLRAGGG